MTSIGASRVLVAGASGFIGGTLTRRLVAQGVRVRAVVRSTSSTVGLALPGVEIVLAEVTRGDSMTSELTQDCDVVISAAGTVSGSLEAQHAVNVDGARNVTTAAIKAGVSRRRAHRRRRSPPWSDSSPDAGASALTRLRTCWIGARESGLKRESPAACPTLRQLGMLRTGDGRAAWPTE